MAYKAQVLSGSDGGTGIANVSKTITLAGNLITSGANSLTLTTTGTTNVTFPTSGTLATTAQIPSFPVSLANGGTNASLTASNGGIFYSSGSAGAILSGTATANKVLMSGSSTTPSWSTPTFPNASASSGKFIRSDGTNWVASTPTLPTSAGTSGKILQSNGTNYVESTPTYPSASGSAGSLLRSDGTNNVYTSSTYPNGNAANTLLYASSVNVMAALPTANNGILATNGSGVPSITTASGNWKNTSRTACFAEQANIVTNATGDGTTYTLSNTTTLFDQASNFDNITGIFTAPVTGKYQIFYSIVLSNLGASHTSLSVRLNGDSVITDVIALNPAAIRSFNALTLGGSYFAAMGSGDRLYLDITVDGGTKTVTIAGETSLAVNLFC